MAVSIDPPRIGVIGVGSIAAALVEGFCTSGAPCRILLSPRGERRGRSLEERFPQARRAASNQEVLDGSDTVFLTLRPPMAREILEELHFRVPRCFGWVAAG